MDYNACIEACQRCIVSCEECLNAMINVDSGNDCPKCCIECSDVCSLCVKLMARDSRNAADFCNFCANVMDYCAEQCEAHDHEHCKKCAADCRKCAEECRKMGGRKAA